MSTGVSNVLKQNATEVERTLLGLSAEVAREFVGKAEEITSAVSARHAELTRLLDVGSGGMLTAFGEKSLEFSSEVSRITEHAVKAIEAKGFTFTRTMMDNSEQIARLINEASEHATVAVARSISDMHAGAKVATENTTAAVARSIKDLADSADAAAKGASSTVTRTLRDLQEQTHSAVETSKQTAAAAVAEMLETHATLRSDTTALFERLREANILLQEVLSGAHENMGEIESTLVTRVTEFVTAMNGVVDKTGTASSQLDQQLATFQQNGTKMAAELGQLAVSFDSHGRSLAEAVSLIDRSNRRTEGALGERTEALNLLINTLDGKTSDLESRLTRFSTLLDQSLEGASERAREVARLIADSTGEGSDAIAQSFELVRQNVDEQYKRTTEGMRSIYERATGDARAMFDESARRFAQVIEELKQMAAEMHQEVETTRTELRKGIFELPQETAESAAQMRRVIVDQIEALAELNRIVTRHGRNLDTVEPVARRAEPVEAVAQGRREAVLASVGSTRADAAVRGRAEVAALSSPGASARGAHTSSPAPASTATRTGWLSELLTRASQDVAETTVREPQLREPQARDQPQAREALLDLSRSERQTTERQTMDSLDSLAVDIARMIDHEAAAELWERYKRGEHNVFTRKLYTMQGQRTFDEIRRKYRGDAEFMQTVDRYIAEFERLLDEVSRDDPNQEAARNYLSSETGKVYTMLAHAAGRFE